MERYLQILSVSLEAVLLNRSRSILTALGIIFGVAAVIAMMAIGNGARQEILDQMKLVGVNNIVILPVSTPVNRGKNNDGESEIQKKYAPGLTLKDANSIREIFPSVATVSSEIIYPTQVSANGKITQTKLTGVNPDYFAVFNLSLKKGEVFNKSQETSGKPVCVIGPEIAAKLFPDKDPLGQQLKCGNIWFNIIGVLKGIRVNKKAEDMGISDYNHSVFVPLKTILLRFRDRSLVSQASLMNSGSGQMVVVSGMGIVGSSKSTAQPGNNQQLDRIVVQVKQSSELLPAARVIKRMLIRRHRGVENFEIKIPELLLKQEQKTKDIFNIVLGAIAGISLLVGGIGIMNIMLASVLERVREIGVRRATGATKNDIVFQFLSESIFISISGGLLGIFLGVFMAKIITLSTGILTIVSFWSIVLSFAVATVVGIIFGYLPSKKAANQDPMESLRHD